MHWKCIITIIASLVKTGISWPYDEALTDYNLNENQSADNPSEYWGEWPDHTYFPSPENWRFPVYTLFLDRFVNGDPTNDNINGTLFEHDLNSNQMRHGGDVAGLLDTLDYLQGMGIKVSFMIHFRTYNLFELINITGNLPRRLGVDESAMGI
jgi:alpha-1,3-glucan synthase